MATLRCVPVVRFGFRFDLDFVVALPCGLVPVACCLFLACGLGFAQEQPSSDQKLASLSGLVKNSVTGEPLAHAHVRLQGRKGDGPGPGLYGAITNVDGRFLIKTIAPGTYFLTAEHRGYGAVNGSWPFGQERDPKEVTLKEGEELKDLVVSLVPDAVISGRVVDANGVPMEETMVEASNGGTSQSARTDDRGEFRIGGLRAGRYLVKVTIDSQPIPPEIRTDGSVETNFGSTYYPSSPVARSAAPVQVRAGQETSGIEIKMLPARVLHVSGTVSFPPDAKNISAGLSDGHRQFLYPLGPDHKFSLWHVAPGRYQVLAESFDSDSNKVMHSAPVEINLTTASVENITLTLASSINLNGRIEFEAEKPEFKDESPSVNLKPVGWLEHSEQDENIDSDGRFKMTEVFPARYYVTVDGLGKNFYVKSVRLNDMEFPDGILDLRRPPAKPAVTILIGTNGATISGTVRVQSEPAAAAVALFYDDEYGYDLVDSDNTKPDGSYSFHGIAPGKYKLVAYDPRNSGDAWTSDSLVLYESVTEKIEVSAGDKATVDLKLLP